MCLAGIVACGFVGDYFRAVGVSLAMLTVGVVLVGWIIASTFPEDLR